MDTTRRIAALLLPIALLAACTNGEEPAPSPSPAAGIVYLEEPPSAAGLLNCPADESPDGAVTIHLLDGSCDPGLAAGTLVETPSGAFLLASQLAWPTFVAAFDAADASDTAAQMRLAWAAYQLRRTLDDLGPLGWNDEGSAWGFLLPTSGGEEDGQDVVTPYDARFELVFDASGNPTEVRFVEICLLPGDVGDEGSVTTVEAPTCPTMR
jgi:hypothetical protein